MILQALNGYYERLAEDDEKDLPVPGFSMGKAHFALQIDRNGNLIRPLDIRVKKGKKQVPKIINAPAVMKASGIRSNFAWDNTGYVLGADNKGKPDRALKTFEAFKEFQHQLCDGIEDEEVQCVLKFLDSWKPENAPDLDYWDEMAGQNVVFLIEGKRQYFHESPIVRKRWIQYQMENASDVTARCLVTGQNASIARLHPKIKGVRGAQTVGASIVSFNLEAFTSYNKKQSFNAPVSEGAAFAYTAALNYLLQPDSRQKIQIGDASTVFWTERKTVCETFFGAVFDSSDSDNKQIRDYLTAVQKGKMPEEIEDEVDINFFILGLSPNASRLSVRFWHVSTVKEISERLGRHFTDLEIEKQHPDNPDFPGMWQLLRQTAVQNKLDNVSPVMAGAFMRSILTGKPYPSSLLSAVITRIRADQTINYYRAAMIKACIVRHKKLNMEVTVGLNLESTNRAYRLGRLFATLESIQIAGHGRKLNKTIRNSYFASASATPRAVFPQADSIVTASFE